jgi:hypothetical protein
MVMEDLGGGGEGERSVKCRHQPFAVVEERVESADYAVGTKETMLRHDCILGIRS